MAPPTTKAILDNGTATERLVKTKDINKIITLARSTYLETEAIVAAHYNEYPPEQQRLLISTRDTLVSLDKAWIEISTNAQGEDVTHILTGILSTVGTVMQLAEPFTKK